MEKKVKYKVFVSSLLNSSGKNEISVILRDLYSRIKDNLKETNSIELIPLKNTSDIWMRDYMPIQIDEKTFVTYEYKHDYLCCEERHKSFLIYLNRHIVTHPDVGSVFERYQFDTVGLL